MSTRSLVKEGALWTMSHAGVPWLSRTMHRDGALVFAYHGVVPEREEARRGEASLHVPLGTFGEQLDMLAETHEVIGLADLLSGGRRPTGRPRAVITFDDAYNGALTLGVDELAKRRLPATFFVAPAFVGGRSFWWDALAASFGGEMPLEVRRTALSQCGGVDERVRRLAEAWRTELSEPPESLRCATLDALRTASRLPGITFAPHTWSHPALDTVSPQQLREELQQPLRWLRESLGCALPVLAVPYGQSSLVVELEARRQGYAAVFPGHGGWISPREPLPFGLPRQSVPSRLSQSGFAIRAAGLRR